MSIVEKKNSELSTGEPIKIITIQKIIDRVNENEYMKDEFKKLKDVNDKNIKLALQLKDIKGKYGEIFNQNKQNIRLMIDYKKIVDRIDFKLMCPELKKEITFYNCCDACYNKICKGLYVCEDRIKAIKENYRID